MPQTRSASRPLASASGTGLSPRTIVALDLLGAVGHAHRLAKKTAQPSRAATAAVGAALAGEAFKHGLKRWIVSTGRPVATDERPEWHTSWHAELLLSPGPQPSGASARLVAFTGRDVMVVNQAFLDADKQVQRDAYNAALRAAAAPAWVAAAFTVAEPLTALVQHRLVAGHREVLSPRRAVALAVGQVARIHALRVARAKVAASLSQDRFPA